MVEEALRTKNLLTLDCPPFLEEMIGVAMVPHTIGWAEEALSKEYFFPFPFCHVIVTWVSGSERSGAVDLLGPRGCSLGFRIPGSAWQPSSLWLPWPISEWEVGDHPRMSWIYSEDGAPAAGPSAEHVEGSAQQGEVGAKFPYVLHGRASLLSAAKAQCFAYILI